MYINTPFNYTGGKFKLLNQIIPSFDINKNTFVDLFCGGGSVYTNILDKYDKVIVNDIISDLIGIHKELKESDDIINTVKSICPIDNDDKEGFLDLRKDYNKDKTSAKLWALMLSCTSNMMRFNKSFGFNQTFGKRTFNSGTEKKIIEFTKHIRKFDNIEYKSVSFDKIKLSDKSFVYIDPPYGFVDNDGELGNKQISEAGYNCYWNKDNEIKLLDYILELDKNGHSFMVSSLHEHKENKSWLVERLLKHNFNFKYLNCDYNKISRTGSKVSKEIIIYNY